MRIYIGVVCALLGALVASDGWAGEPTLRSQVVFGTQCARCHEGQCSGRLSFDSGAAGAAEHIRRHSDALHDGALLELFELLEKMKRECAYSPLQSPVPSDGVWSAEALSTLCVSSRRDYLVPLGELEPGEYRVELLIPEQRHIHAEVLTRAFESLLDSPRTFDGGRALLHFSSPETSDPLLRLRAQEPILVEQLVLRRVPEPRAR